MSQETELPPLPEPYSHIYPMDDRCVHDVCFTPSAQPLFGSPMHQPVYTQDQLIDYGKSCAAAARAKALADVRAELEREFTKLGGMGMYIQGAGIRLGIDAIKRLEEK